MSKIVDAATLRTMFPDFSTMPDAVTVQIGNRVLAKLSASLRTHGWRVVEFDGLDDRAA